MGQQFTSIAKGLNLGGFQESKEEFLEKGKKAQIGEIREWKGQKFQKQPNGGWIPVKQGTKETKKEFSAEDEKWLDRFFDPMDTASYFLDSKELEEDYPNKTIKEFERYISENGQAEGEAVESLVSELHLSNKEATDLFRERSKKLLEEIKKDPEKYGFETEPEKKEDNERESLKKFAKTLEDWGFPVHGWSIKKNKKGYGLKVTAPIDQKWIPESDTMENQEKKMRSVLDAHKEDLKKLGLEYSIDVVPGGRGTLDLACYFKLKSTKSDENLTDLIKETSEK